MSEYRNNNDGGYNDDLYMDAVDTKYTTISGGTPDGGPSGNSSGFGSSPNGMPDESRYSSDAKLWIALRKSPRSFI